MSYKLTKNIAKALEKASRVLPPNHDIIQRAVVVNKNEAFKHTVKDINRNLTAKTFLKCLFLYVKACIQWIFTKKTTKKVGVLTKVGMQINHGRRLREAYKNEGDAGVDKYFASYGFQRVKR